MSNHLHVLLEVPPGCEKGESLGLSEEELFRRPGELYSRNYTASVAREIEEAEALISGNYPGAGELTKAERARNVKLGEEVLEAIHVRYSFRMNSLSEFFKGMLYRRALGIVIFEELEIEGHKAGEFVFERACELFQAFVDRSAKCSHHKMGGIDEVDLEKIPGKGARAL